MSREIRYVLFALIFGLPFAGLVLGVPWVLAVSLAAGATIGAVADVGDNRRDARFKRYNRMHSHYRPPERTE